MISGRLWFCGRKSQRVRTAEGTLFTVPCESVFNTHPEVFRTALVGVGEAGAEAAGALRRAGEAQSSRAQHDRIRSELFDLGAGFEHTKGIRTVLFHPAFPVDIRHNAKIGRGRAGGLGGAEGEAVKALVTGGGGFLGGAIVRRLVERVHPFATLQRGHYPQLDELGVEQVRGDIADPDAVVRCG